jgi:lysozyme family protein
MTTNFFSSVKNSLSATATKRRSRHFDDAIIITLKHEGGFVNDPVDPGGATNWGMSIRYLKGRGDMNKDGRLDGDIDGDGDIDVHDIRKMTMEQAIDLYYTGFWLKYKYDNIDDFGVAAKIFDMTVNMGSVQAGKITQRALNRLGRNLKVDGALGAKSFEAINFVDPEMLLAELRQQQANFYLSLIRRNPDFVKYKRGWLRRAYS